MTSNKKQEKEQINWKKKLSEEEYRIMREKGTEPRYSSKYVEHKKKGIYKCKGCGAKLFNSNEKYSSGCGWPSFWDSRYKENIETKPDNSHGMKRTEVLCKNCGSHLGHVFNDGPQDKTGKRFCINGKAMKFEKNQ